MIRAMFVRFAVGTGVVGAALALAGRMEMLVAVVAVGLKVPAPEP